MNDSSSDDRRIEGIGTPAEAWQKWSGLAALPELEAAALIPAGWRAVVVAPHPDDEVLGCAGLMMQLALLDRPQALVAVTDGTGSHPDSPQWPPRRLARERPAESARALAALGLASVPVSRLELPDTRVAEHENALVELLTARLGPHDVLLTTWRGDGHPDHEATGRACARAAEAAHCRLIELPIWTWHWAHPGDDRVPWSRAGRLPLTDYQQRLKHAAIACHASQLETDDTSSRGPVLSAHSLARLLRPFEVFLQ
ncbi:LmbE family N-acetylglucosaminyl deacetylase [Kushneria sinocarnis]|uniref:LmbE family N-acetylglucosaminyl deacetylase n=1 Tax=Kushneria sinocarnis TaxID=595502 RepID=A0A420WSP6_9GAMM|nr:PIG-L family deacetylase [Kushneria sinocarnis]RKQ95709.1 LmbE family N-acetylglucosaminyl deacetylase [Kushneria sinocarnis]